VKNVNNILQVVAYNKGENQVNDRDQASHVTIQIAKKHYLHIQKKLYDNYKPSQKPTQTWEQLPLTIK